MGFSDIGCYGSEIPTPNLDGLAAGGLRFTQFYNTGRCCPTRASLMTGLYSHQAGMGHMTEDRGEAGYRGDLNEHCVTIAEVLGTAGYRTAMAGKWHVTKFVKPPTSRRNTTGRYSAVSSTILASSRAPADYFYPKPLTSDNQIIQPSAGCYTTDAVRRLTRSEFVDEGDKAKAVFPVSRLQRAALSPASARRTRSRNIAASTRSAGTSCASSAMQSRSNWASSTRRGRCRRGRRPSRHGTAHAGEQDRFDHIMAIYAAVVAHMDTAVGRLVDDLKQARRLDNTLHSVRLRQRGQRRERPNGRSKGKRPARPESVFMRASRGRRSRTRRCAATSTSITKAASPRR